MGTIPYFIWSSILAARDTLNEGLRWKVGDGKSIRFWKDKWLPCVPRRNPIGVEDVELVKELIDEDLHWWDMEKLEAVFNENTTNMIKRIPLASLNRLD